MFQLASCRAKRPRCARAVLQLDLIITWSDLDESKASAKNQCILLSISCSPIPLTVVRFDNALQVPCCPAHTVQ
jgi:hypothetical protein